jgi:hypothetical protein
MQLYLHLNNNNNMFIKYQDCEMVKLSDNIEENQEPSWLIRRVYESYKRRYSKFNFYLRRRKIKEKQGFIF